MKCNFSFAESQPGVNVLGKRRTGQKWCDCDNDDRISVRLSPIKEPFILNGDGDEC